MSEESTFVADGVTYRWRIEEDWRAESLSFSHRGGRYPDHVHVVGDDGRTLSFAAPLRDELGRDWWIRRYVTPEGVERAVRIASRGGAWRSSLDANEVIEAIDGCVRTIETELLRASEGLAAMGRAEPIRACVLPPLLDAMIAIGCADGSATTGSARVAIDDWVASHADELLAVRESLQRVLDHESFHHGVARSAFAFLIDMCGRVNVDLDLDTSRIDEKLKSLKPNPRPYGVPVEHWWFRNIRRGDYDPYDDD